MNNSKGSDDSKMPDRENWFKTGSPSVSLSSQQKVLLNRKANEWFNRKEFSKAEQIYRTTRYSAGLAQMGDHYAMEKDWLKAYELYRLACRPDKSDPLAKKMADIVKQLLGGNNG